MRTVRTWPEGASIQLHGVFEYTKWVLFAQQSIQDYTSTVLFYLAFCIDNVTVEKQVIWCTIDINVNTRHQAETLLGAGNVVLQVKPGTTGRQKQLISSKLKDISILGTPDRYGKASSTSQALKGVRTQLPPATVTH